MAIGDKRGAVLVPEVVYLRKRGTASQGQVPTMIASVVAGPSTNVSLERK